MSKASLLLAVEMAGGQAHLARGIRKHLPGSKVGQVHVWGWLNNAKIEVPPAEVVLPIAKSLGYRMTPHQLRSDLYPNPGDGLPYLIPAIVPDERRRTKDQRRGDRRAPDLFGDAATEKEDEAA